MKRRNILLGLGSLSAAGAAGVGTSAFSLGTVDRNADVTVANEDSAYLAMAPSSGPNGVYATQGSNGNEIGLAFTDKGQGSGVNSGGQFYFDNVLTVENRGTQTVYVWTNLSGGSTFDNSNFYLYPNGARQTRLNDGQNSVLALAPGESANIGVSINTDSVSTGSDSPTMTVRADVDNPNPGDSDPVGSGGDEKLVVSQDGNKGDFNTIQGAIDNVGGTDIVVQPGTYQEELDIPGNNPNPSNLEGLTLRSAQGPGQTTIEADAQSENKAIRIDGVSGVIIDGFEITFNGNRATNAEKFGIRALAGSDGFVVRRCRIGDFSTSEAGRNGADDVDAVRSVGVTVTSQQGSSSPAPVNNPVVSNVDFKEITCTGSTTQDGQNDSDSRAKGVALNGDVRGARVLNSRFLSIGAASNDPAGAQISTVNTVRADVDGPQSSSSRFTTSNQDNKDAEGTDKPRGISILEAGSSTAPTNFIIKGNVFGGPSGSGDEIVGVYGQPAIFVGGSNSGMGPNHNLKNNEFYHPADNLNGAEALNLNGQNDFFDTSGNLRSPNRVSPDQDKDGGNLIDRAGGSNYDRQP